MPVRPLVGSTIVHAIFAVVLFHLAVTQVTPPALVRSVSVYAARPVRKLLVRKKLPLMVPRRVLRLSDLPPIPRAMILAPEPTVETAPVPVAVPRESPFRVAPLDPAPAPRRSDPFEVAVVAVAVRNPTVAIAAGGFVAAKMGSERRPEGRPVHADTFGSTEAARATASRAPLPASAGFGSMEMRPTGAATPPPVSDRSAGLEILDKPRPEYSLEARQLKLEGVVILQVSFGADGQARVLRVVQGLGHGLDENAERAATGIKFHPAVTYGRSVDTVANVRIEFQLAY